MSSLEQRLRRDLAHRAVESPPAAPSGAGVRRVARVRRVQRIGVAAGAAAALAATVVLLANPAGSPDRGLEPAHPVTSVVPTAPTASPSAPAPSPSPSAGRWSDVAALLAVGLDSSARELVSFRLPQSGASGDVLWAPGEGGVRVVTTSEVGGRWDRSVEAHYPGAEPTLVTQPVRDGKGTTFLVWADARHSGDTVEVTTSPGRQPEVRRAAMVDGLALVPVAGPDRVTRVRILRQGGVVHDAIPAGTLLGRNAPRTLDRIVTSDNGPGSPQGVQVRTDGTHACRMTVSGFWPAPAKAVPWNPFDAACARIDGTLQLLLAEDRTYSGVAGVAPRQAVRVRLTWNDGRSTIADVVDDPVRAFLGPVGEDRSPEQLRRAEALDARGRVIATATP